MSISLTQFRTTALTLVLVSAFGFAYAQSHTVLAQETKEDTIATPVVEKEEKPSDGTTNEKPLDGGVVSTEGSGVENCANTRDLILASPVSVSNGVARATVKNVSQGCTYSIGMTSYKVYVESIEPRELFLRTQQKHAEQMITLAPGEEKSIRVSVFATCNYQVDLFEGPSAPQTNPDFSNVPLGPQTPHGTNGTHTLLTWDLDMDLGTCTEIPMCELIPPTIISETTAAGEVGAPFSYQVRTTGDRPMTSSVFNLPPGLSYNPTNMMITGTPTMPGVYRAIVGVNNQCGSDSIDLDITITGICTIPAPVITSAGSASGTVGQPFSYTITATGQGPLTYAVEGVLPAGLVFNPTTHTISGTPLEPTTGITVTLRVRGICADVTRLLTIRIGNIPGCTVPPPRIVTTSNTSGVVGTSFNQRIIVRNVVLALPATDGTDKETPVITPDQLTIIQGSLPPGLRLQVVGPHPQGGVVYRITGTPTQAGVFPLVLQAQNLCGSVTLPITITIAGVCVYASPTIQTGSSITAGLGQSISHDVTVTFDPNDPITTVTATGTLPQNLSFSPVDTPSQNVKRYRISGTVNELGDFSLAVSAQGSCNDVSATIQIHVTNEQCTLTPPHITSNSTASGKKGDSFSYTLTYTGGEPVTISVDTSDLPNGLTYSTTTKKISGEPTETGTFRVPITIQNACGRDDMTLTITIDGGGGGGGGGRKRPNVVLFSTLDSNPEVLGSFISLSQVPYTGVGTTIFQVILFLIGLLTISAGVAYALLRRKGAQVIMSHIVVPHAEPKEATSVIPSLVQMQGAPYTQPVIQPTPRVPVSVGVPENLPIMEGSVSADITDEAPLPVVQPVSVTFLQEQARNAYVLVSDDGMGLIAHSAEGDKEKALERLLQVIEIAKARYPREDGWLVLDKARVREALFVSTLSLVPLFIEWMIRADDKKVFSFLRMLKHQDQPVVDFVRKVVAVLDTVHRTRLEGEHDTTLDPHVQEVTYHLSNADLEMMIAELLHGVDERYDESYTSVRLSLVRVLDRVKERRLSRIGGAYAFQEE